MKVIKSQYVTVHYAPIQIGATVARVLAVGVGFRLSNPNLISHEVTAAIATKRYSTAALNPVVPIEKAEWVLQGCSTRTTINQKMGQWAKWEMQVNVGDVGKKIICEAKVDGKGVAKVSLNDDKESEDDVRLMNTRGEFHKAGLGPIKLDAKYNEKNLQHIKNAAEIKSLGLNYNWPEYINRQFFQQANSDQWSDSSEWIVGTQYKITGLDQKESVVLGVLPKIKPIVLVGKNSMQESDVIAPQLRLVRIQMIPNADIGVAWWQGSFGIQYLLDNSADWMAIKLCEQSDASNRNDLINLIRKRINIDGMSEYEKSDYPLLPRLDGVFAFESIEQTIESKQDKGSESKNTYTSYEKIKQKAMANLSNIIEIDRERLGAIKNKANKNSNRDKTAIDRDKLTRASLAALLKNQDHTARHTGLSFEADKLVSNQVLKDVVFDGCYFKNITIEGIGLHRVEFNDCVMEKVTFSGAAFVDCSINESRIEGISFKAGSWNGGAIYKTKIIALNALNHIFSNVVIGQSLLEAHTLADCTLECLTISESFWNDVIVENSKFSGCSIIKTTLKDVQLENVVLDKNSMLSVKCDSIKASNSLFDIFVIAGDSIFERVKLFNIEMKRASMIELTLKYFKVLKSVMHKLNVSRTKMSYGLWGGVDLDELNGQEMHLMGVEFNWCSLQKSAFYGVKINGTEFKDCNLSNANLAWTLVNEANLKKQGNVIIDSILKPLLSE